MVCDTAKAPKDKAGGGFYASIMTMQSLDTRQDPRPKIKNCPIPLLVMKGQCDNQKWVFTLDGQVALIDAYVVCNAYYFSAQVDHSIKKLLALGVRSGGKSIIQDLVEARNQLEMEIKRQTALQEVR